MIYSLLCVHLISFQKGMSNQVMYICMYTRHFPMDIRFKETGIHSKTCSLLGHTLDNYHLNNLSKSATCNRSSRYTITTLQMTCSYSPYTHVPAHTVDPLLHCSWNPEHPAKQRLQCLHNLQRNEGQLRISSVLSQDGFVLAWTHKTICQNIYI